MAQRKSGLLAREKRVKKNEKSTKDNRIDFSDIPELSNRQLKSMRRVGRPPLGASSKLMIAIRLEPALLEALRQIAEESGVGYQTLIHEILEEYAEKKAS